MCEAELAFPATGGILAGLKPVGFSLWKSPEGEICVTFPSRIFGTGDERRCFDYLRPANGGNTPAKALRLCLRRPEAMCARPARKSSNEWRTSPGFVT